MNRPVVGILVGGASAAALDIAYAFIAAAQAGRSPVRVLQAIASGILGADAFTAGGGVAALGLTAHFLILIVAAAVYFGVSRRLAWLRERPGLSGLAFGVCVYLFMHVLVLPLSAIPFTMPYSLRTVSEGLAVHALLVGLPIAFAIRHFSVGALSSRRMVEP